MNASKKPSTIQELSEFLEYGFATYEGDSIQEVEGELITTNVAGEVTHIIESDLPNLRYYKEVTSWLS